VYNNLTAYDVPAANSTFIYLVVGQTGMFNISGLLNDTDYMIFYYATNEDVSVFALSSPVYNLSAHSTGTGPAMFASRLQAMYVIWGIVLVLGVVVL